MALMLGVELELKVKSTLAPKTEPGGLPKCTCEECIQAGKVGNTWTGPYEIFVSWPKGQTKGKKHLLNGKLVKQIWEESEKKIKVGYDYTVAAASTWAGFEMSADPMSLTDNINTWKTLWDAKIIQNNFTNIADGVTSNGNPRDCGMHVHVSPIGPVALKKLLDFINDPTNGTLIQAIAGRYNNHYCHIIEVPDLAAVKSLYHSKDCEYKGKISLGFEYVDGDSGLDDKDLDEVEHCCSHMTTHISHLNAGTWTSPTDHGPKRAGLNVLPTFDTGDIELRLFKSPMSWEEFLARIEFTHAAVRFSESTESDFKKWILATQDRKHRYSTIVKKLNWV